MLQRKKPLSRSGKPGLRMKALVDATGAPKSTILYYVQQGLLPEPVKTSQNMAYYDPRCITRIRYIQNLQRRHRLSLSEIRKLLADRGPEDADLTIYVELNDIIFGPSKAENLIDEGGFCRATGLTPEQVRSLVKHRLLLPMTQGFFDQDDVRIGQIYSRILESGLHPRELVYYVEYGEKIVDREMTVRRHITRHLPLEQDAAMSMELVRHARMTRSYIIDRLFQHRVAAMRDLKEDDVGNDGG